jgi:hypothetical protein
MRGIFGRVAAVAAVVASATLAQPVSAQLSQLNIVGSVRIFQQAPGAANNVIIDFRPNGTGVGTVRTCCFAGDQTGIFGFIPDGTTGTNLDFVFGPAGMPPVTPTPTPFLSLGGFTFTVTSFGPGNVPGTPIALVQDGTAVNASLTVNGFVTGPGLTGPRNFSGSYTTQFPGTTIAQVINQVENNTGFSKTLSATFTVSAIPEPTTVALMGTGLLAIVGVGLRRRTNA